MWITWMTFEETNKYNVVATVQYGLDPTQLDKISRFGYSVLFWNVDRISFVHRVKLSDLKPDSVYCKYIYFFMIKIFFLIIIIIIRLSQWN